LTSHIERIPTTKEGLDGAIYALQYFRAVYTCDCPKDAGHRADISQLLFELKTRLKKLEDD
jgi:hypothetical protein